MTHGLKRKAASLAAILVSGALAAASEPAPAPDDFRNFAQVHSFLYRGAQPKPGHLAELKAIGIKTILNLRRGKRMEAQRSEAGELGLDFVDIPLRPMGAPDPEGLKQALELIGDESRRPIFVNCKRGSDRTGVVIACYRILHDGWTADRALQEAEVFGMAWWQWSKKRFIRAGCEPAPGDP